MNLLKRITEFDYRKLTPVQIVIGLITVVVVLSIVQFLLNLATTLLPLVILGVLAYFGFRYFTTDRDKDEVVEATNTTQNVSQTTNTQEDSISTTVAPAQTMRVEQPINSSTGLREPDIDRLNAEESRLSQKEADADEIQQQLLERRKRLMGNDDQ